MLLSVTPRKTTDLQSTKQQQLGDFWSHPACNYGMYYVHVQLFFPFVHATTNYKWNSELPNIDPQSLCPGQKWWRTVLEIKSFMQPNERAQHTRSIIFFFFGAGKEFFCLFPCSQYVKNMFPEGSPSSQVVPPRQDVPNSTSDLSHLVLLKVQLSCTWTEKVSYRRVDFILSCDGSKEVLLLRSD
jgi:hypothetical protein